jgi:hypothetical protein
MTTIDGLPVNLGRNRYGRVRVVSVPRGSRVCFDPERHGRRVCYVLSPDAREVVAITADGRVQLGAALQRLVGTEIFGVQISPN